MRRCVLLCVFALIGFTGGAFAQCVPGPGQVAVFEHSEYRGLCKVREIGEYPNPATMEFPNDKMSSVKVGSAVEVVLCEDANYLKHCQLFTFDHPNLGATGVGHDTISSMTVRSRGASPCLPGRNQVSVYMHRDFEGPCVVKDAAGYATPQSIGLPNDSISSARVGADAQLVTCVDVQYLNDCELFTRDVNDFSPTRTKNDRISSMKVQSRGFVECAPRADQAALYMHRGMLGPCVALDKQDYPTSAAMRLQNDSISSLRVGAQVQVCACTDAYFGGVCQAFTADAELPTSLIGNDTISSVKVQARGADCKSLTPPPNSYAEAEVTNCYQFRRRVSIWRRDVTDLSVVRPWLEMGLAYPQWSGETCPSLGGFRRPLADFDFHGRLVELVAVDEELCGRNDPSSPTCVRTRFGTFRVDRNGGILRLRVD